ncbi:MAG: hypothetical protein GEV28_09920 [Actinophytocola sp.]|uniref:DUF6247 family protein n=1 Tax=Actinophytocola sp. TaxID=1872138 RepID=UPI0013224399|nr:DUF6247 family protein [Actinophytocola sp.]MPZ80683.1 hypothetical protein [Actinophytocola sp.]
MSGEPVESPRRRDFKDASPREIRAALVPEERPDFDRQWRAAMDKATETLDLGEVVKTLDNWRTHAMITDELGKDGYRRWLAKVEHRSRTGDRPPGSVPWSQLKVELGL